MALKDWKKEGVRFWQTRNINPTNLSVLKSNKGTWDVVRNESGEIPKTIKAFKTKSQALKFAKSWMRSHPNG